MTERNIEALRTRAEAAEQRAETLHVSLGATRMDVVVLIESREADRLKMAELPKTMTITNHGLSIAEFNQIITQRVASVIGIIAIYETKTLVARELMNQTKRQEDKMGRNASNKRKWEGDHGGSSIQNKEHKVIRAHAIRPSNKKVYVGKPPHCNKCKLHNNGPCTAKCENCKEACHLKQGHYHSECLKLKNQNCGNQARSSEACGRVCALGGEEAD
nr:putative reverse transcriptase domain-containing protein [Tanacetum cinerariifolium]